MTQVTATVKDPNGNLYTGARVEAYFIPNPAGTQLPLASGISVFPTFTVNTTDSFGVVSLSVTGNDLITPAGSQWRFSIISGTTPAVGFSTNITITGSTQDISAALQAAAAFLPNTNFGNISTGSITSTGGQTFTGGTKSDAFNVSTRGDRQIILQNPDFEGSSTLPPPGWTNSGSATFAYETVSPAPGKSQSLKITTTSQFASATPLNHFSAFPGDTLVITAMAKGDGSSTCGLEISLNDKNGAQVTNFNAQTSSAAWTQLTASGVVPANAVQAIILLSNFSATQPSTVWFDQISVQKTNFPAPLQLANGVVGAPSYSFLSNPSSGLYLPGNNNPTMVSAGLNTMVFNANTVAIRSTADLGFSAGDPFSVAVDTGLSRASAGIIAVGTTATVGDITGTIQAKAYRGSISIAVTLGGVNVGLVMNSGLWVLEDATTGNTALVLHDNNGLILIAQNVGNTFVLGAPGAGQIGLTLVGGNQLVATASAARNGDTLNATQIFNH